jgi:glycerol-3-phosphate acyltransferase PlsY
MHYLIAAVLGYLIGAIPTAYLVVKKLTGQDIRQVGSGNVGATNVKRAAGFKPFLFVLLADFLKGTVPVLLAKFLFPGAPWLHVLVALSTVIGHSKSIYLGFAGGKSAATGLGGFVGLDPLAGILLATIAYATMRLTRMVSVGSMLASVLAPILLIVFKAPVPYQIYAAIAGLYVIYLHKANIQRLLNGTENRI